MGENTRVVSNGHGLTGPSTGNGNGITMTGKCPATGLAVAFTAGERRNRMDSALYHRQTAHSHPA